MEILYQDERVIVCVKPAGVLSTDEPGGMPELLRRELGDPNAVIRGVHRLDRAVGGIMVYARTRRAAADLSEQIRRGVFHKEYMAVVHGIPDEPKGALRDWLHRDKAERKTYVVPEGAAEAQEAILEYETKDTAGDISLLRIRLHTGRTHQIRCQLAAHGWPIVGDRKYGRGDGGKEIALRSHIIGFMHPKTGAAVSYISETPDIYPWSQFCAWK